MSKIQQLGNQLSDTSYYADTPKRHVTVVVEKTKRTCTYLLLAFTLFQSFPSIQNIHFLCFHVRTCFRPLPYFCVSPKSPRNIHSCLHPTLTWKILSGNTRATPIVGATVTSYHTGMFLQEHQHHDFATDGAWRLVANHSETTNREKHSSDH